MIRPLAAAALVAAACEAPPPPPAETAPATPPETAPTTRVEERTDSITVYPHFTRGEEPQPAPRRVRTDAQTHLVERSLRELLRGPTQQERTQGFGSFFSQETAGMLRDVAFDDGRLVVDFFDFRAIIPNASTSAGSRMLLQELNATVFQYADVREADYRIEGSCETFWNFLQRDCEIVDREWGF